MPTHESEVTPIRGSAHDALSVFLGKWRAEGTSFDGTDRSGADPKANGVPWTSTHAPARCSMRTAIRKRALGNSCGMANGSRFATAWRRLSKDKARNLQ